MKIAGHEPVLNHAIERFLGRDRKAIMQIAKDTLEGNLRGVLSQLTPEQVNEDKISFAEKLLEEAEHDLTKLGLLLDTLKIQNVADDKGYLKSIGRKSSAELVARSSIAEAQAKSQATIQDAGNRERARVSELESQIQILHAETDRRVDAIGAAILLQAANNKNEVLLAVAAAAKAAAECCCETKQLVQSSAAATQSLVSNLDAARIRDALAAAQQEALLLRMSGGGDRR